MDGKDGDGPGRLAAFERDRPAIRGLRFESRRELPVGDRNAGPQHYRPGRVRHRMPGDLDYLVLLSEASSIEEPACRTSISF